MISSVPIEILSMILLMLPTKMLARCESVCRVWRDLIRDPQFIKRHFQTRASKGNRYILSVPLDRLSNRAFSLLNETTFDRAMDIHVPIDLGPKNFIIVGSCNGLLCISDTQNYGDFLILCNPYIRQCRNVRMAEYTNGARSPDLGHDHDHDVNVTLGFGYHDQTDDYKIVRIRFGNEYESVVKNPMLSNGSSCLDSEDSRTKVEVYSTVTRTWKNIEVDYFPWAMLDIKSEVLLNESIHWKVIFSDDNEDCVVIIAFHIGSETFQQLSLPDYEVDGEDLIEFLGVYKGKLSLFLYHLTNLDSLQEKCYLWVMTEYGIKNSWVRTHTITIDPGIVMPLLFTKNDEIIYDDGKRNLILCDFDGKATRQIGQLPEQGYVNLVTYMDSLVFIDG